MAGQTDFVEAHLAGDFASDAGTGVGRGPGSLAGVILLCRSIDHIAAPLTMGPHAWCACLYMCCFRVYVCSWLVVCPEEQAPTAG